MRRRVWSTVVLTTALLLLASSAWGSWPIVDDLMWQRVAGLMGQVDNLPWTVVALATVSCIMWLLLLVKLYRTWVVRRNLVRVLARFGTPTPVIANTARLSQDGVAFLTATGGGGSIPLQGEVFSGGGNHFNPFHSYQPAGKQPVTSITVKT